jgi:alanine dehydrogenase
VPRETKDDEYRVALLPVGAERLARDGHTVVRDGRIANAAVASAFSDLPRA